MRIDKFLKISRVIKRRTLANEACESGKVKINGRIAKPSTEVKIGDVIEISFGSKNTKIEVVSIGENVSKAEAAQLIRIIE
ncbi:MAG TPA: RNA-binding S4 domain-containing protein [Clostridiaceae bacterium]|jgi:ribosomal 50S subunit-recycling heat shock protein|nr:RNA-binding S4 domain-containing protein [Clostridiaceae bacterium]